MPLTENKNHELLYIKSAKELSTNNIPSTRILPVPQQPVTVRFVRQHTEFPSQKTFDQPMQLPPSLKRIHLEIPTQPRVQHQQPLMASNRRISIAEPKLSKETVLQRPMNYL